MNIKKITALIITSALILVFFTACENNGSDTDSLSEKDSQETQGRVERDEDSITDSDISISNERGNTNGNLVNGGFATIQGDWIYYAIHRKGIYKIRTDGSDKTQLVDEDAGFRSLQVIDDWLYFSQDGTIHKMKTDGIEVITIEPEITAGYGGLGAFHTFHIADGWIYYKSNGINKIKTDGSENSKVTNINASDFNIVGDWIYFFGFNDNKLYKIKTDGSGEALICEDINSRHMNVVGEWIFFIDYKSSPEALYKVKIDGSEKTLVAEESFSVNVVGDWVYYDTLGIIDGVSREYLYKIRTDGSERTFVGNGDIEINIVGDWVYFGGGNDYYCYKMRLDGTEYQKVE